jgi:hypothetical protein
MARTGTRLIIVEDALSREAREHRDRRHDGVFTMDEPLCQLEEDLRAALADRRVFRPDDDVVWQTVCIASPSRTPWEEELIAFLAFYAWPLVETGNLQTWAPPFAFHAPTPVSQDRAREALRKHGRWRRLTTITRFYGTDPRRRHSRETELGRAWTDGAEPDHFFSVTYVEDTGEVYAMRSGLRAPPPLIDGFAVEDSPVEILGVVGPNQDIESRLRGWEEAQSRPNSLSWLRSLLGS